MKEIKKMENLASHHFFEYLIAEGIVTNEQLSFVLEEARHQQVSFISCLMNDKTIDPSRLFSGLSHVFCLSTVDLDSVDPLQLPGDVIEERLLQKYQVLPLWQEKEKLGLAIADPTQQLAIDDISFHTGLIIEKILVEPEKLKQLLAKITKKPDFPQKITDEPDKNADSEIAVIQTVSQLLQSAIERGASDIHVEPYQDHLQIRFRIDGLLYLAAKFPVTLIQRIITRFKIMSQLDIAERRIPQDGRFQVAEANHRNIDCRISTCPTLYGEKLVIRILDSNKMLLAVDKLGMTIKQKNCFLQALQCPHGMVLVTGPTGSGKTITLYTALNILNTSQLNISSVENPIEIVLPGINQVNTNPKIGLDFAKVLRAFLRQDPDIMMVGEMRDQETAEIGIKAAQTGHLVLSSLHTNSAVESLVRLLNMGIPAYNVASSLNLIIAQRLARRLCARCKIKDNLPENVLLALGLSHAEIKSNLLFAAQGCSECTDGYRGRTGIFEMLLITDEIKSLILNNCDAQEIAQHAQIKGMQTLYASALEKLKQGEISLLEMKRIIKD
ncbi:type IV-A pilus assembly ATPase [Candidatus Rickettsiella viridis]|uniref:Type IV-A pilus assembly ATPase n=2 Tax=Candidatus Rickettsiella viridis TaxID=676208 RepID=A0A2Z5V6X4_9COXI|nr:type IV-A pilus assembly ATPase [Candidatus Rickettsiella viridis]